MSEKASAAELAQRISRDCEYFDGAMPERYAIAWHGYLAGLLEWGLLDADAYDRLLAMLPGVADDPVTAILLGRD